MLQNSDRHATGLFQFHALLDKTCAGDAVMTQSLRHPATHTPRVRVQHSLQETQLPLQDPILNRWKPLWWQQQCSSNAWATSGSSWLVHPERIWTPQSWHSSLPMQFSQPKSSTGITHDSTTDREERGWGHPGILQCCPRERRLSWLSLYFLLWNAWPTDLSATRNPGTYQRPWLAGLPLTVHRR